MRLGIMQPYFFPNLAHFALIASVDKWVVFDVTQYTPKSWMNRNRVLHPVSGWNYISVNLNKSSTTLTTQQAMLESVAKTQKTVVGKLSHYKKSAPFYNDVIGLVDDVFSGVTSDSLVDVNVSTLKQVCEYIDIPFNFEICSKLNLDFDDNLEAGQWAPAICQQLNADEYLNPVGGASLFSLDEFTARGIELNFLQFSEFAYSTNRYEYQPHLSILDVLMWNSPQQVRDALRTNCKILSASGPLPQN